MTSAPASPATKWVYGFGPGMTEGRASMKDLLGGKGANLAEMSHLGLPVPPGFTLTTDVCVHYLAADGTYPDGLEEQVKQAISAVEEGSQRRYGDSENPLLLSVRSGARASMPGMMDTVLNLGLNDQTVDGLARRAGDSRFAYDSYRRFLQMYGGVVLGVPHDRFEEILSQHKSTRGFRLDTELGEAEWRLVVAEFKTMIVREAGVPFPQDVTAQLWGAIGAVLASWNTPRAVEYRRINDLPDDWGTAVSVQAMVFGNMGDDCATGVAFTRNPATGAADFYGEFMVNAQGEDVVAGIRTPQPLNAIVREDEGVDLPSMEELMPQAYADLVAIREKLEAHYKDMQDIEFTVQKGVLWMLQTRTGKRTAAAALRIAVEMTQEGLIDKREALLRLDPASLDQLLHPTIDPRCVEKILVKGLPASPGAAVGRIVFSAEEAVEKAHDGPVILCRTETSPEDIHGMHAAQGILTTRGGMTSHAAVVARGMGRPCVTAARDLKIDYEARTMSVRGTTLNAGDMISLDGGKGQVLEGEINTIRPDLSGDFSTIMKWADDARTIGVRANAETPEDARTALHYGAEGIGLARTEHMFFDPARLAIMRQAILASRDETRENALQKLLPMQRQDFAELFKVMDGRPVIIRLLDPPLHEFLPKTPAEIVALAKEAGVDEATVRSHVARMAEANPMLGHRGCRLGITSPEIYQMQVRAILEAALEASESTGKPIKPEIMIPLIATQEEFQILKKMVDDMAGKVFGEAAKTLSYRVGAMIELPRAALRAGDIAQEAAFFSFGTNDLTQTAMGLSRDDSGTFLSAYRKAGIFGHDPFASLDTQGVGELIEIAVQRGRETRPDLTLGICGEHGGDPASIRFCVAAGLDYVSCSPFRVPIARLAAAQAALAGEEEVGSGTL